MKSSKYIFFQGQSQQICAHILLDFQTALYILYGICFHAHIQSFAVAIWVLKHLEPFQRIFVLSIVGRPELSQLVFQAGK